MAEKKEMLRQMASELDKVFDRPFGTAFHWPLFRNFAFQGPRNGRRKSTYSNVATVSSPRSICRD